MKVQAILMSSVLLYGAGYFPFMSTKKFSPALLQHGCAITTLPFIDRKLDHYPSPGGPVHPKLDRGHYQAVPRPGYSIYP